MGLFDKINKKDKQERKNVNLIVEEKGNLIPSVELKPTKELSKEEIEKMIEERNDLLKQLGYELGSDGKFVKSKTANRILYFILTNGLILKIDRKEFTCYRFDFENKKWHEDSVLFTEFEHGNLQGTEIVFEDNYEHGEPFRYKKHPF